MPSVSSTGIAKHNVALTANVETVITLGVDGDNVEVSCSAASAPVYFTTDNSAATVAGDNCYALPPIANSAVVVPVPGDDARIIVRAISTAAASISAVKA